MSRVIEEESPKSPSDLESQPTTQQPSKTQQQPTSNHTPPTPEEDNLQLAYVWQSMIFIMSWLTPLAFVTYAYTGHAWYRILGSAFSSFSLSCVTLVSYSSPSNASIECYLVVYLGLLSILTCGGAAYGHLLSDPDGNYTVGVLSLLSIPCAFLIIYLLTILRRRIGNFSRPSLKEYISNNVFLQGIGSLPPMVYFTSETVKCLLKGEHYEITGSELSNVCGGVLHPQISICLMFFLFLVAKVVFLPLTTTKVEMYELASFRKISLKLKIQMVFIGVMVFANTVNFGILGEGPASILTRGLLFLVSFSASVIALTEIMSIIFARRRGDGRRESQVDRGDLGVVMESFGERVSSGLDVV